VWVGRPLNAFYKFPLDNIQYPPKRYNPPHFDISFELHPVGALQKPSFTNYLHYGTPPKLTGPCYTARLYDYNVEVTDKTPLLIDKTWLPALSRIKTPAEFNPKDV